MPILGVICYYSGVTIGQQIRRQLPLEKQLVTLTGRPLERHLTSQEAGRASELLGCSLFCGFQRKEP